MSVFIGGICSFGKYLFITTYIPEKNIVLAKKINLENFNEIIVFEIENVLSLKEENKPGYAYNVNNEGVLFAIGSRLFLYKD